MACCSPSPTTSSSSRYIQSLIRATSSLISFSVFLACKQILTRRVGTVGGTIGLITKLAFWQCLAKPRGLSVSREKMGDCGHTAAILILRSAFTGLTLAVITSVSNLYKKRMRYRSLAASYCDVSQGPVMKRQNTPSLYVLSATGSMQL